VAEKKNRHVFDNFRCAGRGLWNAIRTQRTMKIHVAAALAVAGVGLAFMFAGDRVTGVRPINDAEFLILVMTIANVLVAEMVNTCLEHMVAAIHPAEHPLLRDALDISAGAVLVASILAAVVGVVVLGPRFWGLGRQLLGFSQVGGISGGCYLK
jgi:diacylglycerol kinase